MKALIGALLFFSITANAKMLCTELFVNANEKISVSARILNPGIQNQNLKSISNADIARLQKMTHDDFMRVTSTDLFSSEEAKLVYKIYRSAHFVDRFDLSGKFGDPNYTLGLIQKLFSATDVFSQINLTDHNGKKISEKILKIVELYDMVDVPNNIYILPNFIKFLAMLDHPSSHRVMQKLVTTLMVHVETTFMSNMNVDQAKLRDIVIQSINKLAGRPYKKSVVAAYINNTAVFISTDLIPSSSFVKASREDVLYSYHALKSFSFGRNLMPISSSADIELTIVKQSPRPMLIKADSKVFKTSAMWKDGFLTGFIIIGHDMFDDTRSLVSEYKSYYRGAGFTFKPAVTQENFAQKFKDMLRAGTVDYIFKEDNGTGSVSVDPNILVGEKKTAKGIERVYIVFSSAKSDAVYWPFIKTELRELVNMSASPELVYVNTTCHSSGCNSFLIKYVENQNFTFIGPLTLAQTFANEKAAPILHLLNGVRKGHTYAKVKENILKNKVIDDDTNAEDNNYIFPDDLSKAGDVNDLNRYNYTVDVKFVDNRGRPLRAEDVLQ